MPPVTPEALKEIVKTLGKVELDGSEECKAIPMDPACVTYEVAGHWIKILKGEVKSRDWTPVQREFFALDQLIRLNKKTLDWALHIPLPQPLFADGTGKLIDPPFLLLKAVKGAPLAEAFKDNGDLTPGETQKLGDLIGRYMARVHSFQVKGAGLINRDKCGVHPGPWQKYFMQVTEAQWMRMKGSGVIEDALLMRFAELFKQKLSSMIGEIVGLVHNDFNPRNVWIDRAEGKFTGILNFGLAGAGPAMVDIASFYIHNHNPGLWAEAKKGYEKVRAMPPHLEQRLPFYSFVYALGTAWFFHQRKDEAMSGYYLFRACEAASHLDDRFATEMTRYAGFKRPVYYTGSH